MTTFAKKKESTKLHGACNTMAAGFVYSVLIGLQDVKTLANFCKHKLTTAERDITVQYVTENFTLNDRSDLAQQFLDIYKKV